VIGEPPSSVDPVNDTLAHVPLLALADTDVGALGTIILVAVVILALLSPLPKLFVAYSKTEYDTFGFKLYNCNDPFNIAVEVVAIGAEVAVVKYTKAPAPPPLELTLFAGAFPPLPPAPATHIVKLVTFAGKVMHLLLQTKVAVVFELAIYCINPQPAPPWPP
jgi:hypothetical protein